MASSRFPLSLAYRGLSDAVWGAAPARASRPQWPLGRTAGSPTGRGAGDPQSGQSCPQSQSLCPPPPVLTAPGTVGTPPLSYLGVRRVSSLRPLWAPGSVLEGSLLGTASHGLRGLTPVCSYVQRLQDGPLLVARGSLTGGKGWGRGQHQPCTGGGSSQSLGLPSVGGGVLRASHTGPGALPGGEGLQAPCRLGLGGGQG